MNSDTHPFGDLSPAEKLQLLEALWDDVASMPDDVPVHDWQKEELARRKHNLTKSPESGLSWDEVGRRIAEIRAGKVTGVPAEQAFVEIRAKYCEK